MKIDAASLSGTGLDRTEIESILQSADSEEIVRRLRLFRCRILEDIHGRQQSLDRIDYIIARLRNEDDREVIL